jgi:hypothetical protein
MRGNDYHYGGPPIVTVEQFEQTGVGPFVHNNPRIARRRFRRSGDHAFRDGKQPYLPLPVPNG